MENQPHAGSLRTGRYSEQGRTYLITTVTRHRYPWFRGMNKARCVVNCMREAQQRGLAETLAYVLMPDHLHWLMSLGEVRDLSTVVGVVKSLSAHRAGCRLWQSGFHDHAVRREEDIVKLARYVVANPLRAGLVGTLRDYPYWDAVWL
jgi:REP element-mobilizing transposase RayT